MLHAGRFDFQVKNQQEKHGNNPLIVFLTFLNCILLLISLKFYSK